jgi:proteasome accessory factor B
LRHDKGTLYLVAFDHDRCDYRTFKVLRMSQVQKLPDKVAPHADFDEEAFFAHSVKVWSGEPIDVRVRFTATVASIVHEYPLVEGQTLEDAADGGVVLTARVAGIPEAMRWVLGWGRDAEVLAPRELREAVAQQVKGAAARYAGASVRAHGKARAVADRAQRAPDAE